MILKVGFTLGAGLSLLAVCINSYYCPNADFWVLNFMIFMCVPSMIDAFCKHFRYVIRKISRKFNGKSNTKLDSDQNDLCDLSQNFDKTDSKRPSQKFRKMDVPLFDGSCYIIGVCGQSGAGKTYVCEEIIKQISEVSCISDIAVVSQDFYYIGGDDETNYDIPTAVDFPLMISHINDLKNGKSIECPIYDFRTHSRSNKIKIYHPAKIIIIEGILIFTQEELRNLCNLKIFVRAHTSTCLIRRIDRDIKERGRTLEEVGMRYDAHVMPSIIQHIEPSSYYADVSINNENNKYVGLELVLYFIKKQLKTLCRRSNAGD